MNTITIDRAVVEQALRAFEAWDARGRLRVMAALRAALEQPQVEKRAAWLPLDGRGGYTSPEPQVEQEPFAVLVRKHSWHLDTWEVGPHGNLDYGRAWADERINVYTHPQNLRCKSTQARLATLWGYVKEQPQQEQEWKRRLGNLLAVIHGDGGHYIEAHGWDKAQADAEERVARVMTGLPQSAPVVWPRTASEVRAFLSGHVAAERYARDDHQPDDSDTYTLSAHDLLGAIDWWTDFDQRPRQPLTEEAERQCPYPKANPSTRDAWLDGWEAAEREHGIGGEE